MTAVRLVAIRDTPLSADEVISAVSDAAAGGLTVFIGTVRDSDGGKPVDVLGYSAHPNAEKEMRALCESIVERFPAVAVAAVHRVGDLAVGDIAVVVAAACAHRGEAFEAARALIDELKATVPIWKHQVFSDGSDEWVGVP
ncbi:MAG TPA: molybdenum cofactor biosynthesis protein MoaE [Mycobacteriales bacterium]|nr:molybdenum cofactor biosynthesis protein MoaE [Mycobacteriales bacterium]